jgi:hypothetical protein
MPLYRYSSTDIEPLIPTSLASERIREREDLQRLLVKRIDVISNDLLVIAEEYSLFQDSRRRIDILALDRGGNLVVIELKRTEDGGHMELQALRYAAMVSTITFDHLVEALADAQSVTPPEARVTILEWIDEPLDELPNHVRIILVSANFSTEITSTVLWLNENYNMDVSCHRIVAYKLDSEILLDLQQIIPLPEAKDFQIQQRQKGAAAAVVRANGRDFTRYDLTLGGEVFPRLSKQAAVKLAIQRAHSAGVSVETIKSVTEPGRWLGVHPRPDESVTDAFIREFPNRRPTHLWFDLDIIEDGVYWVIPRFGGTSTEPMLEGLRSAARAKLVLEWARAESDALAGESPVGQE